MLIYQPIEVLKSFLYGWWWENYTHTHTQTDRQTDRHTHTHTHTHRHRHRHIQTHTQTETHTQRETHTHTLTLSLTHTHTQTQTHTHTHTLLLSDVKFKNTIRSNQFSSNRHQAVLQSVQSVCKTVSLAIKTLKQIMLRSKCLNIFWSQMLLYEDF